MAQEEKKPEEAKQEEKKAPRELQPKEQPDEAPKEQAKETPKEQPKEQLKEEPTAQEAIPADQAQPKEEKKPEEKKPYLKIRITNCVKCNKTLKKGNWYYKNGKYFCNKHCWKAAAQTAKAEAKKAETK